MHCHANLVRIRLERLGGITTAPGVLRRGVAYAAKRAEAIFGPVWKYFWDSVLRETLWLVANRQASFFPAPFDKAARLVAFKLLHHQSDREKWILKRRPVRWL